MLRENTAFTEHFNTLNKNKLIAIVEKHRKNNTLFLSGDVHTANTFKSPCAAFGGYKYLEYTSSGMSHHMNSFIPFLYDLANGD
jgi:phosphodiesterase/alkaline phosphatase D-like protein